MLQKAEPKSKQYAMKQPFDKGGTEVSNMTNESAGLSFVARGLGF